MDPLLVIVLVLVGCAVVVGVAIALWRLSGPGKLLRVGAVNLYYNAPVTANEAERVGQYLIRQKFAMDARLTRVGATYLLQLICSLGQPSERQNMASEVLAAGLSDDVFAGAGVEVQICDNVFQPTATIFHQGRFGRRIAMNAAHLFYLEGVTDSQALEVAVFLAGVGVFDDSPKIAQLERGAEGYQFRLAVEVDPLQPEMLAGAQRMGSDLTGVLGGAPVAVHFCKGLLGTLQTVTPANAKEGLTVHVPGGPYRSEIYQVPGNPNEGDRS